MTFENMMEYKNNAVRILKKNDQYATANAVEIAFKGLMLSEQYKFERDVAVEQLEELGLALGEEVSEHMCIPKSYYEELLWYRNMYYDLCK